MRSIRIASLFALVFALNCVCAASSLASGGAVERKVKTVLEGVIAEDSTYSGDVVVKKDVLVPRGVSLTFLEGTRIFFEDVGSTKVEPENMLPGTEITVMGKLVARNCTFLLPGRGGITVNGGSVSVEGSTIRGAGVGLLLLSGKASSRGLRVVDSEFGVVASEGAAIESAGSIVISGGDVAVAGPSDLMESLEKSGGLSSGGVKLVYKAGFSPRNGSPIDVGDFKPTSVFGDEFVSEDLTLSGDVLVRGVLRVAPGVRLTIKPGTRVLFEFRDTNGDGIGENGIFLQGTLIASGKEGSPIYFGPLESRGTGAWDAINFTASDSETNVLKNVVIEGAYRGVHSHFSDVSLEKVRIMRSMRGIQFQESTVSLRDVSVSDVVSGVRCRDSDVSISRLSIRAYLNGLHMLRVRGRIAGIDVKRPLMYGVRMRECDVEGVGFRVEGGLYGFSLQEVRGIFSAVTQKGSAVAGFMAQHSDVKIERSSFDENGRYGLSFKGGTYELSRVKIGRFGELPVNVEENPVVIEDRVEVERGGR